MANIETARLTPSQIKEISNTAVQRGLARVEDKELISVEWVEEIKDVVLAYGDDLLNWEFVAALLNETYSNLPPRVDDDIDGPYVLIRWNGIDRTWAATYNVSKISCAFVHIMLYMAKSKAEGMVRLQSALAQRKADEQARRASLLALQHEQEERQKLLH